MTAGTDAQLERLAGMAPREMRRAWMTGFGNARLNGRSSVDLTDLPAGILTDPDQAVGRTLAVSLPAARPLRGDMLRQAIVVQQNQSVKVVARGSGFAVANEGRALTNAVAGQVVQVRLANGQIVSGIARAGGSVEVKY